MYIIANERWRCNQNKKKGLCHMSYFVSILNNNRTQSYSENDCMENLILSISEICVNFYSILYTKYADRTFNCFNERNVDESHGLSP